MPHEHVTSCKLRHPTRMDQPIHLEALRLERVSSESMHILKRFLEKTLIRSMNISIKTEALEAEEP